MPSAIIRTHRMPIGTRCNLDQFMGSRQGCLPFHSLIMTLFVQLRSDLSDEECAKAVEEKRWYGQQRPVNTDHVLYFFKGRGKAVWQHEEWENSSAADLEGVHYCYAIHFQFNNKYVTWAYQTKEMRDEDYRRLDKAFVREPY